MPDERESNRFSGRMRRYARVGGSMSGLAARLAGDRLFGRESDQAELAAELRGVLGNLKGPVMKVAQILATIPEALPREFAAELTQLQSAAPPMGPAFVKRRMRSELGADWRARFGEFELEAAHAASLGQVHRARDPEGRDLAVKLQYPDMASTVEADLGQLDVMLSIFRRYDRSIDTRHIRAELADRLREELDYEREGKHIRLYRHMLAEEPAVHVPEFYSALSTRRLLAMSWLDGSPLLDFREADLETRNRIALNMFRAWYVPLYYYGVIHGDPHLGNYTVRGNGDINLLDFGCVRVFRPRFIEGVLDLYCALRDGDEELAVEAYEKWGFENLSRELIDTLNLWASFLYSPLLEDATRLIDASEQPGRYGASVAARMHQQLRELGPVAPPREFVLVDRAAIGLGGVFLHLKAEVNWHRLFEDVVGDFSADALARRQGEALAAAGLEAEDSQSGQ